MIKILSAFSAPSLLSPRTADYVSALIREGDNFDYCRWLQQVRAEEAQAKQSRQNECLRENCSERNGLSNR